jgi:hypothetical protein
LTGIVWRPLVEASRLRHLLYRRALEDAAGPMLVPTALA